jgi:hypothetical protein
MHLFNVKPFEDPQNEDDARPARPMRMALRNSGAALLAIGVLGLGYWLKFETGRTKGPVYWWIWGAVAAFAVLVCFAHAALASHLGARRAGNFLKVVVAIALAAMLFGVWWSLQSKNGV